MVRLLHSVSCSNAKCCSDGATFLSQRLYTCTCDVYYITVLNRFRNFTVMVKLGIHERVASVRTQNQTVCRLYTQIFSFFFTAFVKLLSSPSPCINILTKCFNKMFTISSGLEARKMESKEHVFQYHVSRSDVTSSLRFIMSSIPPLENHTPCPAHIIELCSKIPHPTQYLKTCLRNELAR